MSDEQDARARRALKNVMSRLLANADAARELLRPKAERCPTSAEAQAWRLLYQACADTRRWLVDAGGPAELMPPATSSTSAAGDGPASPKQVMPPST